MVANNIESVSTRLIEEVWNQRNFDLIEEIISPDHVDHDPTRARLPRGPVGMRAFVEIYLAAFPDLHFVIEDVIGGEDRVAIRWRATGTHRGAFMGIEPSGKCGSMTGISIDRIEGDRIVETWANWDALSLLE